jgi:hypothetical protein
METPEALQPCVRREQQMIARLRLAMTRLADAERARIWAIMAAQKAELSIRQSARATGVSPTRMHQVLQADAACAIPVWFSQIQDQRLAPAVPPEGVPPAPSSPGWSHLADAVEVLRWCMAWLEQWEHADHVVVHLRPASEEETECVPFDRPRVLRVLARIVADLEALARCSLTRAEALPDGQQERRARHRQRLAEPEPPPRRLRRWEERTAHDKRWDVRRMREAESLLTQRNALTRRSALLLRRPRYAAQHNPRPAASTVCALRSL